MENNNETTEYNGYTIERRSDGKFNATGFLKQWNVSADVKKRTDVFLRADSTKAFINGFGDGYDPVSVVCERRENTRSTITLWFEEQLFMLFLMWLDSRYGIGFIRGFDKTFGDGHNV